MISRIINAWVRIRARSIVQNAWELFARACLVTGVYYLKIANSNAVYARYEFYAEFKGVFQNAPTILKICTFTLHMS